MLYVWETNVACIVIENIISEETGCPDEFYHDFYDNVILAMSLRAQSWAEPMWAGGASGAIQVAINQPS